jgi:hypothetical protein
MRDGYYGDGNEWSGITADRCQRLIAHTKKECDGWIAKSAKLRALWPATATPTLSSLNAVRREQYGPIARAHRMMRGKPPAAPAVETGAGAADNKSCDAADDVVDETDDDEDHAEGADIVLGNDDE